MNENTNRILTVQYEDNTTGERELLAVFTAANGRSYAALLPLNDDHTVQAGADIELVRAVPFTNDSGSSDFIIEIINTEAELSTAKEAFDLLNGSRPDLSADDSDEIEIQTLSFQNGNGEMEDWKVVDTFDHNSRKYIALIPDSDNDTDIEIHIMRLELVAQGGVEGCEVYTIPSDMEFEEASREFERRVNEAASA